MAPVVIWCNRINHFTPGIEKAGLMAINQGKEVGELATTQFQKSIPQSMKGAFKKPKQKSNPRLKDEIVETTGKEQEWMP